MAVAISFLTLLIVTIGTRVNAWECDYNYESDGQKVEALIVSGDINGAESVMIKSRKSGDIILAFATVSKIKSSMGDELIMGAIELEEVGISLEVLIQLPRILPASGVIRFSEFDKETKSREHSEDFEIYCRR